MQNLTDLSTLKELCARHHFSFDKSYGQNFLVNPGICPKICDTAPVTRQSQVLEIGPGFGTLTRELARRANKVVSIEKDERLKGVLAETLAGCDNVEILWGDALKQDLFALWDTHFDGPAQVCANLPYNITSPVLMRLLEENLPLTSITVMVQQEAARRITARPGTRQAGAISYAVHYYATPALCFSVKPGSFYPPPKVTSSVIRLELDKTPHFHSQPQKQQHLFQLIRGSFAQRRKTLANAASSALRLPKEQITASLEAAGLSPLARPEQLTLDDFYTLTDLLWPGQ